MGGVKLVVFGFDQTLSILNIFKSLAGTDEYIPSPKPYARTERGQLRRIKELNRRLTGAGGFAMFHFGGRDRVEQVRELLVKLKERGVEMFICTNGFIGPVKMCLDDLKLLDFFSDVYGRVGDKFGTTPYDDSIISSAVQDDEKCFLGSSEKAVWKSKSEVISKLKFEKDLNRSEVAFLDDDPADIRQSKALCHARWIPERAGLTVDDLQALEQITSEHLDAVRDLAGLDPMLRETGLTGFDRDESWVESITGHLAKMDSERDAFTKDITTAGASCTPAEWKARLVATFKEWDADGDGKISEDELYKVLELLGVPEAKIRDAFKSADVNEDGRIDYEEFCNWIYGSAEADMSKEKFSEVFMA